jgi:exodeoxyribonuclease VII small subunit
MSDASYADIAAMSFEDAMAELEVIVRRLESGDAPLDRSLNDYMRGNALKAHCQKTLDNAKMRVDAIIKDEQGTLTAQPFDA